MFADCCWWRSLAVDGSSGASRGHAPVMRSPGSLWSRRDCSRQQRPERTCAHGSGDGRPHLSNLCILPAWTRSLISLTVKIIPRIFRIMELPPFVTPAARRPRSCPELGGPGGGEGLLLQVAQATTTHSGMNDGFRGFSPACRASSRGGWCRSPISHQGSSPRAPPGVTGTSCHRGHRILPVSRKASRTRLEVGMDPGRQARDLPRELQAPGAK